MAPSVNLRAPIWPLLGHFSKSCCNIRVLSEFSLMMKNLTIDLIDLTKLLHYIEAASVA